MNPPYMPPFGVAPPLPRDAVQVQAFAMATEVNFAHLNTSLGISLTTAGYRRLQQHFFQEEKKNPTLGELRLLGHLAGGYPLAQRLGPTALYTDSKVIMETWADIMEGYAAIHGRPQQPCTLADVLSLPALYTERMSARKLVHPSCRLTSSSGIPSALAAGYTPVATLTSPLGGLPRYLWRYEGEELPEAPAGVEVGDVLLAIPAVDYERLYAFFKEHPLMTQVKERTVVGNTPLLPAALTLCGGRGLTVNPLTLVDAEAGRANPVGAYLEAWESPLPMGQVRGLLRIPPCAQAPMFTALSEHGFCPRVLGSVTKNPRLIFTDGVLTSVNLHTDILRTLKNIQTYAATLEIPTTQPHKEGEGITLVSPTALPQEGGTMAELSMCLRGKDGFTASLQGVYQLCGAMAAVGIPYHRVSVSPMLYLSGDPNAPLLLSAVCGLYRACTELGIPMVHPEILFKTVQEKEPTLRLSLAAYGTDAPCDIPTRLTAPGHALCLWTLGEDASGSDVRGLLSTVTQSLGEGRLYSLRPLLNQSVLDCLRESEPSDTGVCAGLFENLREALATPTCLGFLMEEPLSDTTHRIGLTQATAETQVSAPLGPKLSMEGQPISVPSLSALKDQETQRRKELSAMESMKRFESLSQRPRTVLLDTDIGPDCDDVGALAVLIYYAKQYGFPIGGICNCTSNKAGNGVIDAVCRRCGIETPPLGQWSGEGFMDGQEHCKYNTAVAEAHSEGYRQGTLPVEDEVTFYRKRLAEAKDGEVMVISIGMFNDLAALLESPADDISPLTGMELVKAKVYALVSMAAILPQGRECNVISDYVSAEKVFKNWPTAIYLSDFHVGVNVKTGYSHITDPDVIMADPLPMSYHLYTKAWNWPGAVIGENASYDLTAVQFAALGVCDLYDLDTPGDLEFYAELPDLPDATRFVANPMGNKIFMTKKVADEVIAESLQQILNSF